MGVICPTCGTQSPEADVQGRFCSVCGKELFAKKTSALQSQAPEPGRSGVEGRVAAPLPYSWGRFQGWLQVSLGTLELILACVWLWATPNLRGALGLLLFADGVLSVLLGVGIVRRKKYVPYLVCLYLGLTLVAYYRIAFLGVGLGLQASRLQGQAAFRLLVWTLSFVYYHKRRSELSTGW